jgi:hypothetical protein
MTKFLAQFLSLIAISCASVGPQPPVPARLDGVEIRFEKRGALLDLRSQRLAESGTAHVSDGEDYWLRLTNRSPYTIEIPTQSMYVTRPPEWVKIGPARSGFAVKDGAVLVVLFENFEGRYGFGDMFSSAYLPSGRSVLFQVPKKYLRRKRGISVDFDTYTESVLRGDSAPLTYRVSFNSNDLP